MHATEDELRIAMALRNIMKYAEVTARHHKRALDAPETSEDDKRYHAGAVVAYVSMLTQFYPGVNWLDIITDPA